MGSVSMINGHIDGAEQCVICGRDIPEGSQVCVICGRETESGETKVYDAIVDYINKHQYPPTVRDLCKLTGYKSTSTIFAKLKALEEKGCIELDINVSRGIKVKARNLVEVVRCKDCKHKTVTVDGEYDPEDIVCGYHMSDGFCENDFCSYGEMCVYKTEDGKCKKFSTDTVTSYCAESPCEHEILTNYDRLRNVSVEEMAKFIDDKCADISEKICLEHCEKTTGNKYTCPYILNRQCMNCFECIKQWLESEVTE